MIAKKKSVVGYSYFEDPIGFDRQFRIFKTKKEAEIAFGKDCVIKYSITIEEI